jgi:hypothetical protein
MSTAIVFILGPLYKKLLLEIIDDLRDIALVEPYAPGNFALAAGAKFVQDGQYGEVSHANFDLVADRMLMAEASRV